MSKVIVERWDGELAIRLPDELVERFQLKEGDLIDGTRFEAELAKRFDEDGRTANG